MRTVRQRRWQYLEGTQQPPPTKGKENPSSRAQTRAEGARRAEPGLTLGPRTWVWIILCLQRVLAWRKPLPQTLHTNGLAPVWTGMWRVRL